MSRAMELTNNLAEVNQRINIAAKKASRSVDEITLITVTKTFPTSDIENLYQLGLRDFGENRDQEASKKVTNLPKDIRWHFQGQIQSNKLKSITSWASCIHSVDQLRYAQLISQLIGDAKMPIFIQVSLDKTSKNRAGVEPDELIKMATQVSELPGISLQGLMAVAPLDMAAELAFANLAKIREVFLTSFPTAKSLSIGMSGDYETAIEYGATHIRIGSSILGNRASIA
jgi:pyridoxal phosphate enzyme (YggS family)